MKNEIFLTLSNLFNQYGIKLYLVGGAVRDFLRGKEAEDFDFVCDASPSQLKNIFPDADFSFVKYGVVKTKINGQNIDIVCFRKEIYDDFRKPSRMVFMASMEEDSLRRDFTINAMYMDSKFQIYDFHHGKEDLKNRIIRLIGNPDVRFKEDPLRILRCIRFSMQLDFKIEEQTKKAIYKNGHLLNKISPLMIQKECDKMKKINRVMFDDIIDEYSLKKYLLIDLVPYKGEIIDLHCDTLTKIVDYDSSLTSNSFHIDLYKLRKGYYLMQCFAIFIKKTRGNLFQRYLNYKNKFFEYLNELSQYFLPILSYDDVIKAKSLSKIGAMLTIEEGGILEGKIENLYHLYKDGVRMITLTWNYPNELGYPNFDLSNKEYNLINAVPNEEQGLTKFGQLVIEKMNELGMIIDVSHASDKVFFDVLKISKYPIVASHSSSRSVQNVVRNLSDEMILALHKNGGVMGLNYCMDFLTFDKKETAIDALVRHIKHIKNLGCIDTLSLGSDFDGIDTPLGLEDASKIPLLKERLLNEGFTKKEIDSIFYKNFLRVMKKVLK